MFIDNHVLGTIKSRKVNTKDIKIDVHMHPDLPNHLRDNEDEEIHNSTLEDIRSGKYNWNARVRSSWGGFTTDEWLEGFSMEVIGERNPIDVFHGGDYGLQALTEKSIEKLLSKIQESGWELSDGKKFKKLNVW